MTTICSLRLRWLFLHEFTIFVGLMPFVIYIYNSHAHRREKMNRNRLEFNMNKRAWDINALDIN